MEHSDTTELLARYRSNYGLDASVTLSDAWRHLELERKLTAELLASAPSERARTFARCYDQLYAELPWLAPTNAAERIGDWPSLLGAPPLDIYEIGSGTGALARALTEAGYHVVATDISKERIRAGGPSMDWQATDGVNLRQFTSDTFDVVLSNQLIEHLHPDDLTVHLDQAYELLRPGGRYVVRTPHAYLGPADVSRVFGFERPVGMHLKEYDYSELTAALRKAGFPRVVAPLRLPHRLRPILGDRRPRLSASYLRYILMVERVLRRLSFPRRRLVATVLRAPAFPRDVSLVAFKPGSFSNRREVTAGRPIMRSA